VSANPTKPGWRAFPHGNLLPAATSTEVKTGAWATEIPVWNAKTCIHCLTCWVMCPDECWTVKDGKNQGVSLEFCKGCGICAHECPSKPKSITMAPKKPGTCAA
jgi:pyruvate ferredoxin oxidoreductase delta subunit